MTTTVPAVYAYPDISDVAATVADHIVGIQNSVLKGADSSRRFKIGIAGGSLIGAMKEGLLKRDDVAWNFWDVYFADERLVPFDSPESNYGQFKKQVLDNLPENVSPNVFPIDESLIDDAQEAADDYEKTLIRGFAAKDSVKLPMFDLLLLGVAPDGHIASLFPTHELLREKYAWVGAVEDAPKPPPRRITLTLPVICHSHRVSFIVEGATKAPIVKTIMERPDKGLPGSLVNEGAAGRVAWFVDDSALQGVFVQKKEYKPTATAPSTPSS